VRSRFGLGTRSFGVRRSGLTTRALVRGGRSSAVVGGRVRVRPGIRGRVGRTYRIGGHHHHGLFGYYDLWYPSWAYPWYRVYPRYGLYFGFGLTWYDPSYATVFVEPTDTWSGPGDVVVEETVIDETPPPAEVEPTPSPQEVPDFPPPATQPGAAPEQAPATPATPDAASGARKPHPDFEPAVQSFLGGRYQDALQHLDRVVRDEPDNGEAWLAVMQANFALGRYGEASTALAKAAALDAFPRGYRFDPHPLYARQPGAYDGFVKALDAHLATHPRDADALLVRAYLYLAEGQRTPARQTLDRVLEVRPDDETAPRLAIALLPPPAPPASSGAARGR
jgi:TolA-binding protein